MVCDIATSLGIELFFKHRNILGFFASSYWYDSIFNLIHVPRRSFHVLNLELIVKRMERFFLLDRVKSEKVVALRKRYNYVQRLAINWYHIKNVYITKQTRKTCEILH